ncbi:phosphatidylinositide phosphatase SAC2-like [Oppia nitens]|uniref:phosphatidylinositide phosphatase SAC2-like n=1 Tax=Oppia nitens TaxID=1686743 RepID=UPI0023DAE69A|nr:phosphatidylinositide phosphatase SAC2-like [Oppia nitens]
MTTTTTTSESKTATAIELLSNTDYIVLRQDQYSLWCSRTGSEPLVRPIIVSDSSSYSSFNCHGIVYGLIGVFQSDKLLLIRQSQRVGCLPSSSSSSSASSAANITDGSDDDDVVYKIQKITILSLSSADPIGDLQLDPCKVHNCCTKLTAAAAAADEQPLDRSGHVQESSHHQSASSSSTTSTGGGTGGGVQKTWNQIKWTASHVKPRVVSRSNPNTETKDKCEKRLLDELYKMFTETESFYYSLTGDLTNSLQRQYKQKQTETKAKDSDDLQTSPPLWKRVDNRFFWNKVMLQSILDCQFSGPVVDKWILPIIQGYVKIEKCFLDINESDNIKTDFKSLEDVRLAGAGDSRPIAHQELYTMTLISRRSRFRAGTRYKRRGVDDRGKCANYVETEQIFQFGQHIVSFVSVRGSVPIYWSQIGHKYRPPPRIDRNEEETQQAFNKHFTEELDLYGNAVVVNLVEKTGREKIINDAYLNHVLEFDNENLAYVSFDFHDYCRGMRFENVSILMDAVKDIIKDQRYCWIDNEGLICEQRGVFRINCIDCLDRTNIVMTAICRTVMDTQFVRLGLLPPEGQLSANCRRIFQMMWANNGDIISRQYAGTVALKGDFTRTGERRLTGVVRDGYHSANRYYLNRFKDAYRQACIDLMQGLTVSDDLSSPDGGAVAPDDGCTVDGGPELMSEQEHHERVKMVIEDCKKILIPESEVILGGWPLVDADPVTGSTSITDTDMDTVLVLTKDSYYVAEYDDQTDRIIKYQKVLLEDLEKIELGPEPNQLFLIKSNSQSCCIRFHYQIDGQSGYFHMFRSTNTRFFNNMAIPIRNLDEATESLKAIGESFKVALSVKELNVPFYEGKLDRRKSKLINNVGHHRNHGNIDSGGGSGQQSTDNLLLKVNYNSQQHMHRNVSDGQLTNLKSVGSRAITGVYSQFSRLKGKWSNNDKPQTINELATTSTTTTINTTAGSSGSLQTLTSPSVSFNVESSCEEDDDEEDDDNESEDEDSLHKLKKIRSKMQTLPLSSSGGGVRHHSSAERTFSSDYSECSDLEDPDLLLLASDVSISTTDISRSCIASNRGIDLSDRLLESCGIIATSPPLIEPLPTDSDGLIISQKSVFHEVVDDFVLDAMKRASLKQLHRKASESSLIQTSSASLAELRQCPSTPVIHIDYSIANSESQTFAALMAGSGGSESFVQKTKKLSKSSENLETCRSSSSTASATHEASSHHQSSSGVVRTAESFQSLGSHHQNEMSVSICGSSRESSLAGVCGGGGGGGGLVTTDSLNVYNNKMKTSQSENAIQEVSSAGSGVGLALYLPNPPLNVKKDLVLSPLSRIAKGVQHLSQKTTGRLIHHLDHQTNTNTNTNTAGSSASPQDTEAHQLLVKRKNQCKSKIIEL